MGKKKQGRYYVPIGEVEGREASVILSQARLIDTKRLIKKAGTLDTDIFDRICEELKNDFAPPEVGRGRSHLFYKYSISQL